MARLGPTEPAGPASRHASGAEYTAQAGRSLAARLLRVLRMAWRIPAGLILLVVGLVIVLAVFPRSGRQARERTIAAWSRVLLRVCGLRARELPGHGALPLAQREGGMLLVVNHINWLDVFVVLAVAPAHFVAKIEIARWPVVGALVAGVGTLFVERGRRRAVHQLNERIGNMLRAARRVAVFPEGTTSEGDRLLPFHANLIEPALRAGVPVVPVGLRYRALDGGPTSSMLFVGEMTLTESLTRVLGAPGAIAELHPLAPVDGTTRHELAEAARSAIAERLALPLDDSISETLRNAMEPARAREPDRSGKRQSD